MKGEATLTTGSKAKERGWSSFAGLMTDESAGLVYIVRPTGQPLKEQVCIRRSGVQKEYLQVDWLQLFLSTDNLKGARNRQLFVYSD